jgi:TctA family transporter
MTVTWQKSLMKAMVWLAAEIILNCVGLDDLADYSEFVFERHEIMGNLNFMYTQKDSLAFSEARIEYKIDKCSTAFLTM